MHKLLRAAVVMAMVLVPLAATTAAQAVPPDCDSLGGAVLITGTNGGDQQCNVYLQVTVPVTNTVDFTTVDTNFGTVLAGASSTLTNAVTGTIVQNGATVNLTEQFCNVQASGSGWGSANTSYFEEKQDSGSFYSTNTGTSTGEGSSPTSCTSSLGGYSGRQYTSIGTHTFSDSFRVNVSQTAPAEQVTQIIHYEVWNS